MVLVPQLYPGRCRRCCTAVLSEVEGRTGLGVAEESPASIEPRVKGYIDEYVVIAIDREMKSLTSCRSFVSPSVMKMFVRLHQTNAILRSREEHAARTINACAAAGLRDLQEC
jgi:hypothetical protein